jgi:hypothetical protein
MAANARADSRQRGRPLPLGHCSSVPTPRWRRPSQTRGNAVLPRRGYADERAGGLAARADVLN